MEPELPQSIFTSTHFWHPQPIQALAIYCSDGRWGQAFDEFCQRSLNIEQYDRFLVPGGPAWLVEPTEHKLALPHVEFLVQTHQIQRIVLITHWGCAFYAERLACQAHQALPRQLEDVKSAKRTLQQRLPGVSAEAYLAMRQDRTMSFHRLQLG